MSSSLALEAPRCAAHPADPAQRTCDRCGAFQCRGCAEAAAAGACPACARPGPRKSREAAWALWLSFLPALSWVPVALITSWMKLLLPASLVSVAAVSFALALIARRRVRQGLALPPRRGQLALTLLLSGAHLAAGAVVLLFLLAVAAWFLLFVMGVGK